MLRYAILSDTHLRDPDEALELLWPHLDGVDGILHAGDVVTPEVILALERIAPVQGVAGNMDTPGVRALWPEQQIIELGAFRIGLIHGSGPPDGLEQRVFARFGIVDAVIFGHSHQPLVQERAGTLLVNPGSPTDRRWAPYRSFALLHVGQALQAELIRLPG